MPYIHSHIIKNIPTQPTDMKLAVTLILCALLSLTQAQTDFMKESASNRDARMSWWRDATFGMFIHWGAYAVPAGIHNGKDVKGIGEWIMHNGKIPIPEYEAYVKQFNPTSFDAKEWVRIAKDAGMKYIVITSKHHDGFCLWDSKVTQYDIMDAAPFKRDILQELADACKGSGVRLCFYHSIMDWHQPDAESKKGYAHQNTPNPDWARYRETYLKPQLAELIAKYDPGVLWFDGEWVPEWTEDQGKDLYNYLRSLKPDLIINNRVGKGRSGMQGMNKYKDAAGDFGTPEQEILEGTSDSDWESCMTMNDTWGFKRDDHNWKSAKVLIDNLVDIAAKGGNYLLNVGPTAGGLIPAPSVERLKAMGDWLRINGEAIYATHSRKQYREGENVKFTVSKDGAYTYAIINAKPGETVSLSSVQPATGSRIRMLGSKKRISWSSENGRTNLTLPSKLPSEYAVTLKIQNG
ncbi:MAG: alpha-L-fucosidase [Chitinophagia bacterium]|nr:alpha-L-fucosidase [Chitinophagia bacterium]